MIVGACGFGSTGSSVVTDYLKEYNGFQVLDAIEFTWVSGVDGLIDLDYHVNHPHNRSGDSIYAIDRYRAMCEHNINKFKKAGITPDKFIKLTNEFLDSIVTTSWQWNIHHSDGIWDRIRRSYYARFKIVEKWEGKNGRHWEGFPLETVKISVLPEDFDKKAKQHVRDILQAMGADFSKPIILDQPFAGNNPQACFKFFDDPYAVVVDRDPRDNYVFSKTKLLGRMHLLPINNVEDFAKYYRALRKNQPYTQPHERVLSLKFEDFVYHYDAATAKLRDFFHLPDNPNPKSIFDPAISMPNTQVWKRFPQYAKDIEYIEKELPEYLFDYTGCPEPDPNGKMFYGKSPLNKG